MSMLTHLLGYQLPQPLGYIAAGVSLLLLLAAMWGAAILKALRP